MTRQIVLDTETTGLNPRTGDRIIEIGCVEIVNRKLTGNDFHHYLNPERDSDPGALAVHGLTTAFLSDKPKFAEVAEAFCAYVSGAEILIHNAPFDVGFLNAELTRMGLGAFETQVGPIIDTLTMAKAQHPGKRNSLDALCDRYGVSNAHRSLHGALLDAQLLAEVYLAMSRGQHHLLDEEELPAQAATAGGAAQDVPPLGTVRVLAPSAVELEIHAALLQTIEKDSKGRCLWLHLPQDAPGLGE